MESSRAKLSESPYEKAHFLAKILPLWALSFYKLRKTNDLTIKDIYEPLKTDASKVLGDRLEANWNKAKSKSKHCSLHSVILRTFWKKYVLVGLLYFFGDCFCQLGRPFLLKYLLEYFRKDSTMPYNEALLYASGIIILSGANTILGSLTTYHACHGGYQTRVAVVSLFYRKALRLSPKALSDTSPGKMVNLLTNDVSRFDMALCFIHSLWVSPLLTIIIGYLVWSQIGLPGLIGFFVVLGIVPILSYGGKLTSKYRLQTALKTDERIRFMNEIITGVQVIKMYAWEKPFAKLIAHIRKMEMNVTRKACYIRGFHITSALFTPRLALFCSMFSLVLLDRTDNITASTIFTISTYFSITTFLVSMRFSRTIAEALEVFVCLNRLQKFFELDEKHIDACENQGNGKHAYENGAVRHSNMEMDTPLDYTNVCISMKNVRARWAIGNNEDALNRQMDLNEKTASQPPNLNNLNIDFERFKLIGIIGPVGSGKSSLLQAILRELPLESGSINIDGTISYANQEPWIFAASVRQNILFGQEYDRDRYNAVIKSCALERDFEQFENGDLTLIGERGASVSGGQKARINLARACYRNADIYLMDDPLSAVDTHVGTHIFDKCIGPKGYLANRRSTRILVTHQVHFLKEADWIVVLKNGKIEIQGTPSDLNESKIDFAELVGVVEKPDTTETDETINRKFSRRSTRRSVAVKSSIGCDDMDVSEVDDGVELEASSKGKVKGSLFLNYFRAGASWPALCVLFFSFLFVQLLASAIDYWLSFWTEQENIRSLPLKEQPRNLLSTRDCIYVQAILIGSLIVFGVLRGCGFFAVCAQISKNIHNLMFEGIISTTMRFFDTNPSGRILNRFSNDLGTIDEYQPKYLFDVIQYALSTMGSVIVATIVNPYLMLPILVLALLVAFIQNTYLNVLKKLTRMVAIVHSPAFTHLNATLSGLNTIRAFKMQSTLRKEFDHLQDMHSGCAYMIQSWNTIFGLTVEVMTAIFIMCVILFFMLLDMGLSGDKIGLAISQSISFSGIISYCVLMIAHVNNQNISIERSLEYRDLKREIKPAVPVAVTKSWPSHGCIEFRNVFYRYFEEAEPVLRDLSLVIKPMEKIGVIGRTGAGKSSLIGSLFRLACIEGEILIDGIDTANVQLDELRKRIAIIPQDPFLFSGTLRRNLDPFEEYSDDDIWSALENVELKSTISGSFGLESNVQPNGANFSVGQRQLLCLARAILRKNRILVLDEATANVDPKTDLLIQQTIRKSFIDCTVLTIAHRLHTIVDSDRILVMDSGKAIEFDEPQKLLDNENGTFYGMVKALGENELNRLTQIARENSTTTYL